MKKTLTLVLLLAISALSQQVAAHDVEVDGIYYNLNTSAKTAAVTFQGSSYSSSAATYYTGDVTIPSTFVNPDDNETYTVTSIGERAFYYCSSVTSVTMPSTVTSIGGVAFQHCSSMTEVNFSDKITSIADWSFGNCSSLVKIELPEELATIGGSAFRSCSALKTVIAGSKITRIYDMAFNGCSNLTTFVLNCTTPPTLNEYSTYYNFTNSSIMIFVPEESISAYQSATNWSRTSTAFVDIDVFTDENQLSYSASGVTIDGLVYNLSGYGATLTTGNKSCTITDVIIPGIVTYDSKKFFVNGMSNSAFETASINSVTINSPYLSTISDWAFGNSTTLKKAVLPYVTTLNSSAFRGSTALVSVIAPSLTTIKGQVFQDCTALSALVIDNATPPALSEYNTSYSGYRNFYENIMVFVPASARSTYANATTWKNYSHLYMDIAKYKEAQADFSASSVTIDGQKYNLSGYAAEVTTNKSYASDVHIPEYVEYVNGDETYTFVVNKMTNDCYTSGTFTKLTFASPTHIKYIRNWAFGHCEKVNTVVLPEGIIQIGSDGGIAFGYMYALQRIVLPASLQKIGSQTFYGDTNLKTIIFKGSTPPTIGSSDVFKNIAENSITVIVPTADDIDAYTTALSSYSSQIKEIIAASDVPTVEDGYYYIVNKDLTADKAIYSDLGLTLKWNTLQSDDARYVFHITQQETGNYSIQNLYNEAYVGTVSNQSTPFPLTETLETEQTFTQLSSGVWRIASSTYDIGYHADNWGSGTAGNIIAWELTTEYGNLGTYPYSKWELRAVSESDLAEIITKRDAERAAGCVGIVFIGNSITQGVGVSNASSEAAPVVTGQLVETYSGKNVGVRNCGHSGSTTLDWLSGTSYLNEAIAAASAIRRYGTPWFSIMLGTNDSAESGPNGSPVSTATYKANLKNIIDALLSEFADANVVVNYPIWYSDNTYNSAVYLADGLARLQSYHPIITELVAEYQAAGQAVYAGSTKAYSYFENNTSLYTAESGNSGTFYLHPNTEGASKLAQFWAGSILGNIAATTTDATVTLSLEGSVDANTLSAAIEAATDESTATVDISDITLASSVTASDIEQEGNTIVYISDASSIEGKNIVKNGVCSNLVLTDKKDFAPTGAFTATAGTASRQLYAGLNTVCMPFAFSASDISSEAKVYTYSETRENTLSFTEVDNVEAGVPCLVEIPEGTATANYSIALSGASVAAAPASASPLVGTFVKQTLGTGKYKLNDEGKFVKTVAESVLWPFRFCLDISGAASNSFAITFSDDDPTSINSVAEEQGAADVVSIYGEDGVKRASLQKGINILKLANGKAQKVFIK